MKGYPFRKLFNIHIARGKKNINPTKIDQDWDF
jgi:hypothetical protein